MGKVTGFLEIDRQDRRYKPASDRIRHYKEFVIPLSQEATKDQAARCMNCGVPYCMGTGRSRPARRLPGEQPDPGLERPGLSRRLARRAHNLHSTNNFPSSPAACARRRAKPPARST
jgi:glutamate synthase (NADPH/NADH) small chain